MQNSQWVSNNNNNNNAVDNFISECNKLAHKEYKNRHDRVGKVIHWKKCKNQHFAILTNMYKPEAEILKECVLAFVCFLFSFVFDFFISFSQLEVIRN